MEANKILNADILDILFDGKNKKYGAYDLRKTYNSRLGKALIITCSVALLIVGGTLFAGAIKKSNENKLKVLDTELADVKKDEAAPPPPPPPPPDIKQIKFTPPKIVPDDQVKPEEKPEEIKDDAAISNQTKDGSSDLKVEEKPQETAGSAVQEEPKEDPNQVFTKVENEAEFPGGPSAWTRYLQKNLDGFSAADEGAPAGTYKVIVRFIVSRDGSISDVVAETKYGYGMEQRAIECIKKGPKWTPALQNGRNVNAYRRQPITFQVEEQ